MPSLNLEKNSNSAEFIEEESNRVFGEDSFNEEIDFEKENEAFIRQQRLIERREKYKQSFKPKKEIEEHDNIELPLSVKTKLEKTAENLKQIHKENVALGFAVGTLNEVVQKLQEDMILVAKNVDEINKNPYSSLYSDKEDNELETYEQKIDEDLIVNNVLAKIKEVNETMVINTKKKKVSFKKEYFLWGLLLFLVATNPFVHGFFNSFLSFFKKESLVVEYKVKKGDKALCNKNGKEEIFNLKEGTKIMVDDRGDARVFFVGEQKLECKLLN